MRGDGRNRRILVPIVLVLSCLLSSPGEAANINVIPSISLEGTWDSNIFNTSTNETSDYIYRARPQLSLILEAFHTSAKISGGFEAERYVDHDELNEVSATNNFDLTVNEPFRFTPNFSLLPSASYVETRDSARRNRLTQTVSPELLPSETVVTARTKVREYRASLHIDYLLSPNVDLGLGGGGTKRQFVDPVPGANEEDSQTITGDASVSYRITPRFSSGIFVNTSHNTFDVSPSSTSYTAGLTANYLLTQFYSLNARAGASRLEETAVATGQTDKTWVPYGSLSLTYTWQYFQATLQGTYEIAGAGSFGRATKRGNVAVTLTNQFAERWWWDLSGSYQTNRSTDDPVTEDIVTTDASAGIRYTAVEWASFRLSGNVIRQRSDGIEGDDLDRESVFLGVDLSKVYRLY